MKKTGSIIGMVIGISCIFYCVAWIVANVGLPSEKELTLKDSLCIEVMKREIVLKDLQIIREKRFVENLKMYSK
jgi:hypothetical protein